MSHTFSAIPSDPVEATRDFQKRLARLARATFVVAGLMLLGTTVAALVTTGDLAVMLRLNRIVHVLALLVVLAVWRLCRGQRVLSFTLLAALDAGVTITLGLAWAMMGLGSATEHDPIELSVMLATSYTLLGRSAIVTSTFQRTLWISAVAVLPTLLVIYHRSMAFAYDHSLRQERFFMVVSALWCAAAVFSAAALSRLLFGLRERLREISRLGQYTLEEKIGEGGMGAVYRATHALLRRPAAIKLLLPGRASEKDLARFEREVQNTSQLAHPNTVSIFDYGRSADGVFYYVMEYLPGLDLSRLVALEGPVPPARALHILIQASGALAEAHLHGLIHRDIKPANIMLTTRVDEPDVVKVVDFGLVKTVEHGGTDVSVTVADTIVGTPMYLAPEAIRSADAVDPRADIYALGAVAYFLLTGEQVFECTSTVELCSKHLLETPVPPSQRLGRPLPQDLESIVLSCLAKFPNERPANAQQLTAALLACEDAARYDVAAARSWWRQYEARGQVPDAEQSEEHAATMLVDLRERRTQAR